jgi:hypothetical protein
VGVEGVAPVLARLGHVEILHIPPDGVEVQLVPEDDEDHGGADQDDNEQEQQHPFEDSSSVFGSGAPIRYPT